ncbi:MAG: ABC transporter permease [Spirochaetota bacterium]
MQKAEEIQLQLRWGKRLQLVLVEYLIWVIIVITFLIFSITIEGYFTIKNLHFILYVASPLGLLVFAEAFSLLAGNLDLSISQNTGLTAMLVGVLLVDWAAFLPTWSGILFLFIIGALLGSINGFIVGKIGINPFLVTLATYLMFNWMTYYIRKGAITNVPRVITFLGGAKTGGIYNAIIVLFVTTAVLYFVLDHTRFGGYVRAVGGNPDAASMLGINIGWVNFWVFTLSGFLSGGAALLYIGYLKSIPSTIAEGDVLFLAFAGAIIGGVSLKGGRGSIIGALGGVILLGVIEAGTTMTAMDAALRGVFNGLILLIAILINAGRAKLRDRILMPA